jgi:hypothetical protein
MQVEKIIKDMNNRVLCRYSERENVFKLRDFPDLHGIMADLAISYMRNSYRPHPISAFVCALMFGAVICSRNFRFEGSLSNLFTIISGDSGSGKNDLALTTRSWNSQILCKGLVIEGSSFTSSTALHRAVAAQPQTLMPWDEFGRLILSLSKSELGESVSSELTMLFTSNNSISAPKAYASPSQKKKGSDDSDAGNEDLRMAIIKRPALSLLGFGTYSQMNELMTEENFESGDLTRFLYFFIPRNMIVEYELANKQLPKWCVDGIRDILVRTGATTLDGSTSVQVTDTLNDTVDFQWKLETRRYNNPIDPIECYYEEGRDKLQQYDLQYQELTIKETNLIKKGLLTRHLDKIKRIAIIFSLLNHPYTEDLDYDDWKTTGHLISKLDFENAKLVVDKDTKVMDEYQDTKMTFKQHIIDKGNAIIELLKVRADVIRKDIADAGIKIFPKDWIEIQLYLEQKGVASEKYKTSMLSNAGTSPLHYHFIDQSPTKVESKQNQLESKSILDFHITEFKPRTDVGEAILKLGKQGISPLPFKYKIIYPDTDKKNDESDRYLYTDELHSEELLEIPLVEKIFELVKTIKE